MISTTWFEHVIVTINRDKKKTQKVFIKIEIAKNLTKTKKKTRNKSNQNEWLLSIFWILLIYIIKRQNRDVNYQQNNEQKQPHLWRRIE
jgi:hypothetical protein